MLNAPAGALAQVRAHVAHWPTDALVAAAATNISGLIGMSGHIDREQDQLDFLEALAPHFGSDWWFNGHYGMALSELGHHHEARHRIERSLADRPHNAGSAHAWAHYLYETGDAETSVSFMGDWLNDYPSDGLMFGHLNWHLGLVHLGEGRIEEGLRLFDAAFAAETYRSPLFVKMLDAPAFLWRAELAGQPRDTARWQKVQDFAHTHFPNPGMNFVDWHVALTDAALGDDIEPRTRQIEALVAAGKYSSGQTIPNAARGFAAFARGDYQAAISSLEAMFAERIRMAGSRAQLDLIEFTLLKSYLAVGQTEDARRLVSMRRHGPGAIPVAGLDALGM
jgi:tetratricopeptide (TPR) repeat protein